MDSLTFSALCTALDNAATCSEASLRLVALRSSSGAPTLAKSVLEAADSSTGVQFQAALLLRDSILRSWPSIPTRGRCEVRDWCLSHAVMNVQTLERPVLRQLIVCCAVMWKRGWLEIETLDRGRLFELINSLFAGPGPAQLIAASLCLILIEEFAASDAGAGGPATYKSTALGLPAAFHAAAARSFEETCLREVTIASCSCLLRHLQATFVVGGPGLSGLNIGLTATLLETLVASLSWETSGRSGINGLTRFSRGHSWSDILADPNFTLVSTISALYSSIRQDVAIGGTAASLGPPARQVLGLLCCLSGEVFVDQIRETQHAQRLLHDLLLILASPLQDSVDTLYAAACSTGRHVLVEDIVAAAHAEVVDIAAALSAAIRTYRLEGIAGFRAQQGSVPFVDISALYSTTSGLAAKLLGPFYVAAQRMNELLSQNHPGSSTKVAADDATYRTARETLRKQLEGCYDSAMSAVGSLLDVWVCGLMEIDPAFSSGARIDAPLEWARQARMTISSYAASLYEQIVRTRLAMGSAIMRCGLDDDDPFEDASALQEHMQAVAIVGRTASEASTSLLSKLLNESAGHMRHVALSSGSARPSGTPFVSKDLPDDPNMELSMLSENLWWLLGYAGYLLADEPSAEQPVVPHHMNELSKVSAKAAISSSGPGGTMSVALQLDPAVSLSIAVLQIVQLETARLCADPSAAAGLSPLLTTQLAWFISRWARVYLMPVIPDTTSSGASLSHTLTMAFGAGQSSFADVQSTSIDRSVLKVLPVQAGVIGGRESLELVLIFASVTLSVWGGAQGEVDAPAAALEIFRVVLSREHVARYAVLSPAICALSEAVVQMIEHPEAAEAAAANISQPGLEKWQSTLLLLTRLNPNQQSALLSCLLTLTTHIGFESVGYEEAQDLVRTGSDDLDIAIDNASRSVTDIFAASYPSLVAIVARWVSFYCVFLAALQRRFVVVSQHPNLAMSLTAGSNAPTDPRLGAELDRLLALYSGMTHGASRVPDAWHLYGTLPCVSACPLIVSAYRAHGQVVIRTLQFLHSFLDVDWSSGRGSEDSLRHAAAIHRSELVYGSIVGVVEAFGQHSTVARLGPQQDSIDEEQKHADVLLLLAILEKIGDLDITDFVGVSSTQSGSDVSSPASRAMLVGLAYLVPLVTQGNMLSYPRTAASYMTVVSIILSRQPAMAARLDAGLFSSFVASLDYGLQHVETEVVKLALEAVRGMAVYHVGAKRKGSAFAALDLSSQLAVMPDLFGRFIRPLFSLVLCPTPVCPAMLGSFAETMLALIHADSVAYQAVVQGLLSMQSNAELADRLSVEFTTLTSGNGLDLSFTLPKSAAPVVIREAKARFRSNFEEFVIRVRGLITVW